MSAPAPARSWVAEANAPDHPFPLQNLPYGVFTAPGVDRPACGVAIGNGILDLSALAGEGILDLGTPFTGGWNAVMAMGPAAWAALRARLAALLAEGAPERGRLEPHLVPQAEAAMHLPFAVAEYTDFYAGRHHAENVGTMFRGPQDALPPNWLSMPIGYNGRASTVVVSGTDVVRPLGQTLPPGADLPVFGPSRRLDFELELGAVVGGASAPGRPVSLAEAEAMIFGYVLLNDWSARDLQAWEYRPLGPFQSKAFATSVSPWIVTAAALAPCRTALPERARPLLPYLGAPGEAAGLDVALEVDLAPAGGPPATIARTNARELYYSAAQQLAHHASSGCAMRVGDLLGSGTISGPEAGARGSLLEITWGGRDALALPGGARRTFVEDGDTVTLRGAARGPGWRIGFGACAGTVRPAPSWPGA